MAASPETPVGWHRKARPFFDRSGEKGQGDEENAANEAHFECVSDDGSTCGRWLAGSVEGWASPRDELITADAGLGIQRRHLSELPLLLEQLGTVIHPGLALGD